MPKTIILAIFTLALAVAALVTNVVSPYPGGVDSAASATPTQIQTPQPVRSPLRAPVRGQIMQASNGSTYNAL
ncbi:MAG: hypothetical protein Q8M24_10625 [Pseudolabrys sp.]|nr:hypothetical protein [Pseudolabrys sp.]MDP2295901.1 hypothetical protein [Pseudolabrys sp.]